MGHPRHEFLVAAFCLALAACTGPQGDPGATGEPGANGTNGANGANGTNGTNGISTGTITGTLTYQPNPAATPLPAALPATNVTITAISITDSVVSATSDANGGYTLTDIPAGIHTLRFSGNAYSTVDVSGISVLATKTTTVDRLLTATNPIILTPTPATAPAGFGATATLGVTVSGGTAPYTYKWVAASANPTAVTLSSTTEAAPSFTTGTLAAIIASGKAVGFAKVTNFDSNGVLAPMPNPQIGFLPVSAQQLAQMTYNFTVTVTDAMGYVKSATVAVPPATLAQGNEVVPQGQIVIANLPGNTTAATLVGPTGTTATLKDAATANPWFIPDVKGNYTLTAGTTVLQVNASNFTSAAQSCTNSCHSILPAFKRDNVIAKFKDWNNSAHGNHFFKYMHYDASGALVWNTDLLGRPLPAPTANPYVNWSQPGAMTTFQFGMSGAEGTHYSGSCTGCHTTGYNALASNNGFDDVARAAGWSFPNMTAMFPVLTGPTSMQTVVNGVVTTTSYDQVTGTPVDTAWAAIPAAVKAYAGMQCESCHGPLGGHSTGAFRIDGTTMIQPVQEFDTAACAVCHDKPGNHDRVALWRQSGHANLEVALGEGAGVSSTGGAASPRPSCNRCHSAQGFVQYLKQLTGTLTQADGTPIAGTYPGNLVNPASSPLADAPVAYLQSLGITADKVQPITCAACHDAHSTELRLEGDTPLLPSGFRVNGAGSGAICFVCHNSRNGARGDQLNGVYTNNDNPGTPAPVTAIGAPHEACQGDVVAGRNAFFVGTYNPSAHLSVKDSCVGCHMKNFPYGLTGTNTNHTWKVDSSACASCHGGSKDPVDGEGLQRQFDAAAADVMTALNEVGQATVRGLYYKGSAQTVQIPLDATAVFATGRSSGFVLTFTAPIANPNAATGTITTLGTTSSPAGLGNFYTDSGATVKRFDVLRGTFAKANWNYSLLEQDASRGVHNPSYAFDVLSATVAAIRNDSLLK